MKQVTDSDALFSQVACGVHLGYHQGMSQKATPRKKHPVEFKLRLTVEESTALTKRADKLGLDKSDVLRTVIRGFDEFEFRASRRT
jgi:hypothetical protein